MIIDILVDIFLDILMMPLSFILGFVTLKLRNTIFRSNYKKKLRLSGKALSVNCFTANPDCIDNEEHVNLGYIFEYMSVGEIKSSWEKKFENFALNVQMAKKDFSCIREQDIDDNLLIIGGPFHNSVTKNLFFNENNKLPFYFESDATLVYTGADGTKRYSPKLTGDGKYYETDYALILNVKNPANPQKRVIAIIGCRSVGCYGGAVFLSKYLNKKVKNSAISDEYALVVKCYGNEEQVTSVPELVGIHNLENH